MIHPSQVQVAPAPLPPRLVGLQVSHSSADPHALLIAHSLGHRLRASGFQPKQEAPKPGAAPVFRFLDMDLGLSASLDEHHHHRLLFLEYTHPRLRSHKPIHPFPSLPEDSPRISRRLNDDGTEQGSWESPVQATREPTRSCIAVLFVHGHRGDPSQILPTFQAWIQSHLPDETLSRPTGCVHSYAVSHAETSSGFHGRVVWEQGAHLSRVLQRMSHFYNPSVNGGILLLAHSMGGVVARAAFMMPDFPPTAVTSLITSECSRVDLSFFPLSPCPSLC